MIAEEGRQLEYDVAGLEDGEPVPRRSLRYASVRAQGTEVGELPHPPRAKTHEPLERGQIAYLADPPNIAFDVRLQVVAERLRGIQSAIVNPRIESRIEDVVQRVARSRAPPFGKRERQEPQQRRAAGERLADGLGEAKLLAPDEDEEAGAAVIVGQHLQVGQEIRDALDFVQDRALGKPCEKAPRVGLGECPLVGSVQVHMGQPGEGGAAERGLPRLPRPGDRDERVLPEQGDQDRGDFAGDHGG